MAGRCPSLCPLSDFIDSPGRSHQRKPQKKITLALIAPDSENEVSFEFQLTREKLKKVIDSSHSVTQILIWDRLQNFLSSPPHHIIKTFQEHNVHGLFIVLRFSAGQQDLLESLRTICACLWTKRIFTVDEGCPPLPLIVIVHGAAAKRSTNYVLKHKLRSILETCTPPTVRTLDLIKVRFVWSLKNAEKTTEEAAIWLKKTAKWYEQQFSGRRIWDGLDWADIFQQGSEAAWKTVAKNLIQDEQTAKSFRLNRSQSEPVLIPRQKPVILNESLVTYGEESASVAAQLKHFSSTNGIWKNKNPRAHYLHSIFEELVSLRECVRRRLVQQRQYFQKIGLPVKSGADRFYTRFQWIKSYSGDWTSRLIIYFKYGSVVQYSVARMREPLSPCDIQILRGQLLSYSESKSAQKLCKL